MSDLSLPPLTLAPLEGAPAEPRANPVRTPFRWPTPPFAAYPGSGLQLVAQPCQIEGLNGATSGGTLLAFDPVGSTVQVQLPPSRGALTLRFEQFRRLTLTTPLLPLAPVPGEPHADILDHRSCLDVTLTWHGGAQVRERSMGHVETEAGLFLFPPEDEQRGSVRRSFLPRGAYAAVELGPRIGELLVEQRAASMADVEEVAEQQQRLRGQRLGELLVTRQLVSAEQLLQAIDEQARMPMVRIGEALTMLGLISADQLDLALAQQQQDRGVPLGELLVRSGLVSREQLQMALARKMGYPVVDVQHFPAEVDALRRVPMALAQRLGVLPLLLRGGRLVVAMEDPTRRAALDELEFAAQAKPVPVLAPAAALQRALPQAYERFGLGQGGGLSWDSGSMDFDPQEAGRLVESLERQSSDAVEVAEDADDGQIQQSDNSLVRLINQMIVDAANQRVSDIHVETQPGREKLRIRFRKDGQLKPYLELPHTYRSAFVARIKVMCDLDISERRKPQDGKINFAKYMPQHKLELRVATIPTHNGLEDVVMRLLASAKPLPLPKLGLAPDTLQRLTGAIERPYGMVLCVGPTGSGKTTTLHSCLAHRNTPDTKIWTAEDPIEITQAGLRQVQVNARIDWTFAKALRAFLRADPDVIMVGEIRDPETAQVAIEASLTGHLVLSTLHTNSAPETVTRLLDMGMDPFNFADSLLAVLAQRLVRGLCPKCRVALPATEAQVDELLDDHLHAYPAEERPARDAVLADWLARYGRDGHLQHHRAPGCSHCEGEGRYGRVGLHELLVVTRPLRRLIQTGAHAEALLGQAMREGMRTLRQDGIEKVLMGRTTIEEVRATSLN
jgi:type II secretory ATPase GspE/PulE/Tfp pilus assembly ATPase PilB-like protein